MLVWKYSPVTLLRLDMNCKLWLRNSDVQDFHISIRFIIPVRFHLLDALEHVKKAQYLEKYRKMDLRTKSRDGIKELERKEKWGRIRYQV